MGQLQTEIFTKYIQLHNKLVGGGGGGRTHVHTPSTFRSNLLKIFKTGTTKFPQPSPRRHMKTRE